MAEVAGEEQRWPGWPGDNVFRMIVPVTKVGGIIGKKGDLIKKLCEETKARVRVLDPPSPTLPDRIVLISAKEEVEAEISPAMDAVLRVFKNINGLVENDGVIYSQAPCSARLLVASSQAINLIGKQGATIKSIQEDSGAVVRIINGDETPLLSSTEERVVDIQGEPVKVLKALQAVIAHLRKFLVDHGVIALFEKPLNNPVVTQDQQQPVDAWGDKKQSLILAAQQAEVETEYRPLSRDSLYLPRDSRLESQVGHGGLSAFGEDRARLESQIGRGGLPMFGEDRVLAGPRASGLGRPASGLITQITQRMQVPLTYAEDIIGRGGSNISYIRRTSGATLTIQQTREGLSDEIVVEIEGTPTQVQTAQQLIEECIEGRKEPARDIYSSLETIARPSDVYGSLQPLSRQTLTHLANATYPSSSLAPSQTYGSYGGERLGGYGSEELGGYGNYRY